MRVWMGVGGRCLGGCIGIMLGLGSGRALRFVVSVEKGFFGAYLEEWSEI